MDGLFVFKYSNGICYSFKEFLKFCVFQFEKGGFVQCLYDMFLQDFLVYNIFFCIFKCCVVFNNFKGKFCCGMLYFSIVVKWFFLNLMCFCLEVNEVDVLVFCKSWLEGQRLVNIYYWQRFLNFQKWEVWVYNRGNSLFS